MVVRVRREVWVIQCLGGVSFYESDMGRASCSLMRSMRVLGKN